MPLRSSRSMLGAAHAAGQRGGAQHEVDAHALLLGEAQLGVVPVGVDARDRGCRGGRRRCSRRSRRRWNAARSGSLTWVKPLRAEKVDVPDVLVLRGDVQVAHQRDLGLRVRLEPGLGLVVELSQPVELIGHVLILECAAVGHVEAPDAHAAAGRGDGRGLLDRVLAALAEDRLVFEGPLHVLQAYAGGDRHAVPLAQAEVRHLVAVVLEQLPGEVLVLALGFLDGQHVHVGAAQPGLDAVGAGADRVHIPCSDLHPPNLSSAPPQPRARTT